MYWSIFVCGACGLKLEIGWVAYKPDWQYEPLKRYSAITRLICKECGTQYAIEMAGQHNMDAYQQLYEVIIDLYEPHNKLPFMKLLRQHGVKEAKAKDIVENLPYTWKSGIPKHYTSAVEENFKDKGLFKGIDVNVKLNKLRQIPIHKRGSSLPDRLLFKNKQVFLDELPEVYPDSYLCSNYDAIDAEIYKHRRNNDEEWQEIKPIEINNNEIILEKQPCQNCLAVGKISSDIRGGDECPHCKDKTLIYIYSIVDNREYSRPIYEKTLTKHNIELIDSLKNQLLKNFCFQISIFGIPINKYKNKFAVKIQPGAYTYPLTIKIYYITKIREQNQIVRFIKRFLKAQKLNQALIEFWDTDGYEHLINKVRLNC